jgi:hypothetical protein
VCNGDVMVMLTFLFVCQAAAKIANMFDEAESSAISVAAAEAAPRRKARTSRGESVSASSVAAGLTVSHKADDFAEGAEVILTLKDKGVLDDEDDDEVRATSNTTYSMVDCFYNARVVYCI